MAAPGDKTSTSPDLGWRGIATLTLVAALVVGLLTGGVAEVPGPKPRLLHPPEVTAFSDYLNNGYAEGAHVLSLPGNLVGMSADGSVAATRSTGGQITGYRLSDGQAVWQVSADQIAAAGCPEFEEDPESPRWRPPRRSDDEGVVVCEASDEPIPLAALNLRTGQFIDFGFLRQHPEFRFEGVDDRFIYVTVVNPQTGEVTWVSLDFDGREVASLVLFEDEVGAGLDPPEARCWLFGSAIQCWRGDELSIFDAATGVLQQRYIDDAPIEARRTADGYSLDRSDHVRDYYTRAGELVGSWEGRSCPLEPSWGVEYSNADYLSRPTICRFILVGPSGRIFAESRYDNSFCSLSQAGLKVPLDGWSSAHISSDERVIALLYRDDWDTSAEGARLFDAHSGELIASFPFPWALAQNGIIYWTAKDWEPDNPVGTQILVPGS